MNISVYESIKPIIVFFKVGIDICYKCQENVEKVDWETIENLKDKLVAPYKILFFGISLEDMSRILECLKTEENGIFWYREKNPKTDVITYHAIITISQKVKKL